MDTRGTFVALDRDEAAVRARSAELPKELSGRDLAFAQIVATNIAGLALHVPGRRRS